MASLHGTGKLLFNEIEIVYKHNGTITGGYKVFISDIEVTDEDAIEIEDNFKDGEIL